MCYVFVPLKEMNCWPCCKAKLVEKKMSEYPEFYFGYGSNLHLEDFYRYCKEKGFEDAVLEPVCSAFLVDYVMQFHYFSTGRMGGAADVIPVQLNAFAVPGMIFKPNEIAWQALDRKEGHPKTYKRIESAAACTTLQKAKCATYIVVDEKNTGKFEQPTEAYVKLINDGLQSVELGTEMLCLSATRFVDPETDTSNINKIFVYGTLRKGQDNHFRMQSEQLVATKENAHIKGAKMYDMGTCPGLTAATEEVGSSSDDKVIGEVYEYSGNLHEILTRLDQLEGYSESFDNPNNFYNRMVTKVFLEGNEVCWAWLYVSNDSMDQYGYPVIESGDWVKHDASRK